jgi:YebC/PmpR family DNA-binding regulatory protein
MGRAYEVRKASIQKTGAVKAKLYSMYAKEIYLAAKTGGIDADANLSLRRLIDKAKKDQVPSDLIKRAIDKVNSGADESYSFVRYELFGPGGSTLIVDCLTDNVNRTLSYVRPALNKNNGKMGVTGSVAYMYEHLGILRFNGLTEEEVLEVLINANVEVDDIEVDDSITVYTSSTDLYNAKEALLEFKKELEFEVEEVTMLPKEKVTLEKEDKELFDRMYNMLDEIEDVQNVYHNVNE